jgi:glycosyltransferase involved in cell wall biosynthesis
VTFILFIHPSDEMYGADRVLLEVIEAVPPQWEKEVWLPNDVEYEQRQLSNQLRQRGVSVRIIPLPILRRAHMRIAYAPRIIGDFLKTRRLLRERRPEIVYLNTSATLLCRLMCNTVRTAVIVHVHEYFTGIEGLALRMLMWRTNKIIVVSRSVGKRLGRRLGDAADLIYNGFDIECEASNSRQAPTLTFVLASRWNSWKGHASLLRAWSQIRRDDVRLLVLGGPPPTGAAVDVDAIVAAMPNRDSVKIVGQVEDPLATMSSGHILLVPSTKPDPLPTVAIEAMGLGVAVMASRIGGLPEIVADGKTGWLLPPDAIHLGRNGRRRYEAMFEEQAFRQQVRRALEEVSD